MPHRWMEGTEFVRVVLDVEDRACRQCGRKMHVCDHRRHSMFTLEGPRQVVCRLVKCPDRSCPGHHRTVSPEREAALGLPRSILGWDVFCWIGHRRFARHWSVPQILVVRELTQKRIWFGEALVSRSAADCSVPAVGRAVGKAGSSVDVRQTGRFPE